VADGGGIEDEPGTGLEAERLEAERLAILAATHDHGSARLITRLGIRVGWRCLEVGTGQGSMARWLAEAVGAGGEVLATDLDLRFVGDGPDHLTFRRHDIGTDPLPTAYFDLAHARGVLQSMPQREQAVTNMTRAVHPGGWVVVEDVDWQVFDEQTLPEPFGELHRAARTASAELLGYDPFWGRRVLGVLGDAGLTELASRGRVTTMYGGTPSAEWYILALERNGSALVAAGLMDAATIAEAIDQARSPEFVVLGPLEISAWGQVPD